MKGVEAMMGGCEGRGTYSFSVSRILLVRYRHVIDRHHLRERGRRELVSTHTEEIRREDKIK